MSCLSRLVHQDMISRKKPPGWFAKDDVLTLFGSRRAQAMRQYKQFVLQSSFDYAANIRNQVSLGDEPFIMQVQSGASGEDLSEIPRDQKRAAPSVEALDRGQGSCGLPRLANADLLRR